MEVNLLSVSCRVVFGWRQLTCADRRSQSMDKEVHQGLLAAISVGQAVQLVYPRSEHSQKILGQDFRGDIVANLAAS